MHSMKKTVGDIESFIDMLRAACEDRSMNATLQQLLTLPDSKRKAMVHMLARDMVHQKAPRKLIEAVSCLADNAIAEKAYEVIYQCVR